MESQPVILIQIARRGWTISAVHAACQMAREIEASILLVKTISVQHISWLGTEVGYMDFTLEEQAEMTEYQEIIEEYEIDYIPYISQYVSLTDLIVQMVEKHKVQIAFATLPPSIIPGWRNFQLHRLRQHLGHQHCELIESPLFDVTDSISTSPKGDEDHLMEQIEAIFYQVERL